MFRSGKITLVLLCTAVAAGQPVAEEKQTEPAHMSLVRQLGASAYTQRENAAKKLLELGVTAKPALAQGMELDDLEVRLGAHRILVQVLQNDFDERIRAFLEDQSPEGTHDLPGWPTFRDELGNSYKTRQLYAEMLRAENDLITAVGRGDSSLEQLLSDRIQYLTSRPYINGRRPSLSGATLATILFIGKQAQKSQSPGSIVRTISPTTSRIYSILTKPDTKTALLQGAHSSQIMRLMAGWIDGVGNSQEQYGWTYAMRLALDFDLREQGPRVARKVLKSHGLTSSSVPYAAIVLGRFGTVDDVKHLKPHLGSTQVFHTWSNAQLKKEPIRIQVRDAVLAMIIRLHGEDPAAYGYKLLQADEQKIYKVYTLGFLEDADRDATFAKWEARQAARKDAAKPPKDAESTPKGAAPKSSSVPKSQPDEK